MKLTIGLFIFMFIHWVLMFVFKIQGNLIDVVHHGFNAVIILLILLYTKD